MPLKVNLGCGQRWKEDWVNIDWSWNARIRKHPIARIFVPFLYKTGLIDVSINWPPNLLLHDLRKKLPFENETVDCIYTGHVIEHLKRYECIGCLQECFRILRKGGVLRIVTPDLRLLASKYVERDRSFLFDKYQWQLSKTDCFADRFLTAAYWKDKEPRGLGEKIKSKHFSDPYHQWLYDFESLSSILRNIGFQSIEECKFGEGKTLDIKIIEGYAPAPESLYIEAKK